MTKIPSKELNEKVLKELVDDHLLCYQDILPNDLEEKMCEKSDFAEVLKLLIELENYSEGNLGEISVKIKTSLDSILQGINDKFFMEEIEQEISKIININKDRKNGIFKEEILTLIDDLENSLNNSNLDYLFIINVLNKFMRILMKLDYIIENYLKTKCEVCENKWSN